MTALMLAIAIFSAQVVPLATAANQQAAWNGLNPQIQAAYVRQATYILGH